MIGRVRCGGRTLLTERWGRERRVGSVSESRMSVQKKRNGFVKVQLTFRRKWHHRWREERTYSKEKKFGG